MSRSTLVAALSVLFIGACSRDLRGVSSNRGAALTVFSPAATPTNTNVDEGYDTELGCIFFSDSAGTVNGIHFYKGTQDTGAHTGHLWSSTGTLLATIAFSGETASGWQYMAFSSPVSILANTRYVASYHTTTGFSWDPNYFASQVDAAPLHVPAAGGVFTFGSNPIFPTSTYENSNYWVDVDFTAGTSGSNTTLFDASQTPASEAANTDAVELGIKFTVDTTAVVHGIRFYKTTNDTGTHVGHLWDQSGTLLATVTFSGETATGWQEQAVSVPVAPGQTYTASYSTSASFGFDDASLTAPIDRTPLHAPASAGVSGAPNGFPQGNFYSDNYWVDVDAAAVTCAPSCSACGVSDGCGNTCCAAAAYSVWAASDAPSTGFLGSVDYELGTKFTAAVSGTVTHLRYYRTPNDTGTETGHLWDASGSLLATVAFSGTTAGWQDSQLTTPVNVAANQTYVASYQTSTGFGYTQDYFDSARSVPPLMVPSSGGVFGNGGTFPTQVYSNTSYFADVVFQPTPKLASLFGTTSAPSLVQSSSTPFELGVQFTSDVDGALTQLRFYKAAGATGSHIGHLWDNAGNLLATAPFTNETASGWQQVTVSPAIALTANTTYVASYSSMSNFAWDQGFFGPGFDRAPLHVATQGGVFAETITTYPTETFDGSNYWADFAFQPTQPNQSCAPICSGVTCGGSDGCGGECCSGSGCDPITTCDPQCQTVNACGAACSPVADNTVCTVSGSPGTCQSGACVLGSQSSVFNDTGTPASSYLGPDPYELGMKFTSDNAGNVTKVRFFKPSGATGPHVGHLWDGSGNLLGTVSFSNETASGWQEATFATPIAIAANTSYVVSYSEHGGFAYTLDDFASGKDVPPLHVPAAGGIYGNEGSFPTQVYADSNYWVDVVVSF